RERLRAEAPEVIAERRLRPQCGRRLDAPARIGKCRVPGAGPDVGALTESYPAIERVVQTLQETGKRVRGIGIVDVVAIPEDVHERVGGRWLEPAALQKGIGAIPVRLLANEAVEIQRREEWVEGPRRGVTFCAWDELPFSVRYAVEQNAI